MLKKSEKIPKTPAGWNKMTGTYDEKAEKAKKPGGDKKRKTIPLKKEMRKKGLRLKGKDIYDILRKGFGKDVTFADKIEYRLYWIFLRTWVFNQFWIEGRPWVHRDFDFIEDLMREFAASKDRKSFKKLVKKLVEKFNKERDRLSEKIARPSGRDAVDKIEEHARRRAFLDGIIKELKRICEALEKASKKKG